jgi:hypothetical protein
VFALIGLVQAPVYAQNATSGLVTGTVVDPANAAVGGATVTLQSTEKTVSLTATTNAAGIYTFPNVSPGFYSVTAAAKGFQTTVVSHVNVDVMHSYTVNITLQVGSSTVTLEVKEQTTSELETTSSTVGQTLGGEVLEHLPTLTRSATALMFLQPAVSPPDPMYQSRGAAVSDNIGGQVAGSRSEQITFMLDGGDVTSDLEGSDNYISPPGEPQPAPIIPAPQEMTQEFRVGVSNPNATFNRSSGGQVAILTKQGTNAWHGEGYEYNTNDGFNANSWTNNTSDIAKPHLVDNRFGGNVGGPIWKDKLWFFAGYEGRRFYENATGSRIVPIPNAGGAGIDLEHGYLRFPDATGTVRSYNLATAMDCSATGTAACDPRGLGVSPTIAAQMALLPAPTAGPGGATCGDGFNTGCYLFAAATPYLEDIGVFRLDWTISNKWNAFFTFHTADSRLTSTSQAAISATAPAFYPSANPFYPDFFSFQVTGQLTPNLTLVSHGSYLRNYWAWNRDNPGTYGIAGTTQVLELTGEGNGAANATNKFLTDPVNVDTPDARGRVWDGRDVYMAQDFSYTHGSHLWQFGASFYRWNDYHFRTDEVLGGLTNFPAAYIDAVGNGNGLYATVGPNFAPPACPSGSTTATFCLPGSLSENWNELYAADTGIVDHSSQIATYSGKFQPNPLGSGLFDNVTMYSPYGYVQDVWKVRPSLTITLGVDWGAQLNPSEANNKETLLTSAATGAALNYSEFLSARANVLGSGISYDMPFNPQFSLTPVADVPAPFTDQFKQNVWKDFGPRISVAWNVPYKNWLFGDKKTVIRAGYVLLFDRTEAVSEVLNPLLAGGLASSDICGGPVSSGVKGAAAVCSGTGTTPATAYRIGVDGPTVPIPAPVAEPIPYVFQNQYLTAALDPYVTPAHSHNVNFDIQRSLPWNMVMDLGYIGKFSRNLLQGQALSDTYYGSRDKASGQTEAQAFAAVATAVQQGKPIPTEPWFENQLANASVTGNSTPCVNAAATLGLGGVTNCSTLVAAADPLDFGLEGLGNWAQSQGGTGLNQLLPLLGLNQMDNQQILAFFNTTSDHGTSNYNALFLTLNKALSNNLQFQFNWTYSKAIGDQGLNAQYLYASNSPYHLGFDYAPELFDHQHVINVLYMYNLPFGKGQAYKTGNDFVDRQIIGGWTLSGVMNYFTGLPLTVNCDGDFGTAFFLLGSGVACNVSTGLNTSENRHVAAAAVSNPLDSTVNGQPKVGGGTGLNIFSNPANIIDHVTAANIATTGQIAFGNARMIPSWSADMALAKTFTITERVKVELNAQFLNIFNHPLFVNPNLDATFSGGTFGELTTQTNNPRQILLGGRIIF